MTAKPEALELSIRHFSDSDAGRVRDLFVTVNRMLAPAEMKPAFEQYIEQSLADEMARIPEYYADHDGSFWVAETEGTIVAMFGLESRGEAAMELRRMYVDPAWRRRGIAGRLLQAAEDHCRSRGFAKLELSTSELQQAALTFYRSAGYSLIREDVAAQASNKTIGGGIRRYYFEKDL